jgi:hypothetical protein
VQQQQQHMQDSFGKLADLVEGEWMWPLSN